MKFKDFIIDLFRDERGSISIKPLVAIIGSLFLCGSLVVSFVTQKSSCPPDSLIDAIMIITCVGMGADSVDKFSHKKTPNVDPEVPSEEPKQ